MKKILFIEDDTQLQKIFKTTFETLYDCTIVGSLEDAYASLSSDKFEVVVVDRVLPDGDGLELIEYLSDSAYKTKVIALSAKSSVPERIRGLEQGADEYLAKPFSLSELKLRIQKLCAIDKLVLEESIRVGNFELLPEKGIVSIQGKQIQLRKKEMEILHCLFRYKNRVVTREMIIDDVWSGTDIYPTMTTLDVYIRRLRVLLKEYSSVIETVRGFGYRFTDSVVLSK